MPSKNNSPLPCPISLQGSFSFISTSFQEKNVDLAIQEIKKKGSIQSQQMRETLNHILTSQQHTLKNQALLEARSLIGRVMIPIIFKALQEERYFFVAAQLSTDYS